MKKAVFFSVIGGIVWVGLTLASGCGGGDCKTGYSFKKCVQPIFNKSCGGSGCHDKAEKNSGELKLVNITAKELMNRKGKFPKTKNIDMVVPKKPEESLIYLKVIKKEDRPDKYKDIGNVMPLNKEPLTADEIETIKNWILNGAEDN